MEGDKIHSPFILPDLSVRQYWNSIRKLAVQQHRAPWVHQWNLCSRVDGDSYFLLCRSRKSMQNKYFTMYVLDISDDEQWEYFMIMQKWASVTLVFLQRWSHANCLIGHPERSLCSQLLGDKYVFFCIRLFFPWFYFYLLLFLHWLNGEKAIW